MSTTNNLQNTIYSLENLFTVSTFFVPQYQRAYAWEAETQLEAFLEDLRQQVRALGKSQDKRYFLGTFLLHEEDIGSGRTVVNIVDGQQRMTTAVLFIATALALHNRGDVSFSIEKAPLLQRTFVYDEMTECQKFHTIKEDDPLFRSEILHISDATCAQDSASSRRLMAAAAYFTQRVEPCEWEPLINALKTARVMVYAVQSPEDATQIFELQNDRGKSLTNLEALKSFLMHCIYLNSKSSADDRLAALQTQFSKIYRMSEALTEWSRTPDEDQLLSNHCAAFTKWSEREYSNPKRLVKTTIKAMEEPGVISWIEDFVSSLVKSYRTIEELFDRRDELSEFSELVLIGRMGPFWPLILKTWRFDESKEKRLFRMTCRLLEVFAFRGYAVANLRSDTGYSTFATEARDFEGNFDGLFKRLADMSYWHNIEERFVSGLNSADFYHQQEGDALYLLWRYENCLRLQPGRKQPLLSWRDYAEPASYAAKLSVEHIAAQSNPLSDTIVSWTEGNPAYFRDVALNRLGNLVIDSISPNAAKGMKDFTDKLDYLSENSIYLSQSELKFIGNRDAATWGVEEIRARHEHLIEFAKKTWDPKAWNQL